MDLKLKELFQLCMKTHNYKKMAVVGFTLLSNHVDEIALKLGIRPRNKEQDEKLFEYLSEINKIFQGNLKIPIFKEDLITLLQEVELVFLRARGNVPLDIVRQIIKLYYFLKVKCIPNLHEHLTENTNLIPQSIKMFSLFSPGAHKKARYTFDTLLKYKIRELSNALYSDFDYDFESNVLEKAILLKNIENSLEHRNKNKIKIQGPLKDNIIYQRSQSSILGYFILGMVLVLGLFGTITLLQLWVYPETLPIVDSILLYCFGPCLILIILYYYYFKKRAI